ncbi:MAG: SIS domain-containing protein [Nitrospinae bacterium]|nr:SIS domain-containing protein [Nitrospinota bacterium]
MTSHGDRLKSALTASIEAKKSLLADESRIAAFDKAAEAVVAAYKQGNRLYIAGNGGSAADAQHLAAEFVCRLSADRPALPAEALSTDTSTLTAIGNDYGFDQIFSRQIEAKAKPGDVFLAISTSGNSPNILLALKKCREKGIGSILFTGRNGGAAKGLADHCVIAYGDSSNIIQEQHIVMAHTLCSCVEDALFRDA